MEEQSQLILGKWKGELPETISQPLTKPDWEVILTTSHNRRFKSRMSIHAGLFDSLWSNAGKMGEEQSYPMEQMTFEVKKQEADTHGKVVTSLCDWLWHILNRENIGILRFSTGKFLDKELNPHYDNFVDLDVSMVLEKGSKDHLQILIDKMLGFERRYSNYISQGDTNESKVRSIQSE
jgi:hypothetical protein